MGWLLLVLTLALLVWAARFTRRAGGTIPYERRNKPVEGPHSGYGLHNPWGSGNE